MRTRLVGFAGFVAAVMLGALGATGTVAQADEPAVEARTCMAEGGTVEYDSATGLWTCIDGKFDGEPID
ncbi:hypothetical protein ACFV7Q_32800 [Streptomyces sp. NPDC059851]|uniref:hypothetical protein n=1 Tax=Streptomyces sp. NPDC059851 TaxID=3346971 RepID=UPI0036570CEA